jgi:hypothetical protein
MNTTPPVPSKVRKKGFIRTIGIIIIIILSLLAVAYFGFKMYEKYFLESELNSALRKSTGGLYSFAYDEMTLDEVNGTLEIKNLNLYYDSVKYKLLEEKPSTIFIINIPQLNINGIKTPQALLANEIDASVVRIQRPNIQLIHTNAGKYAKRITPEKEVYEQILGDLTKIKIDSVMIEDAGMQISNLKDTTKNSLQIKNVNIALGDILVNEKGQADLDRYMFAKSIQMSCGKIYHILNGGWYALKADSIYLSTDSKRLAIDEFQLEPRYDEETFVRKRPYQVDRFDVRSRKIMVHGIDMQELTEENICIDSVIAHNLQLNIYRDLSYERDTLNRVGKYPHQLIAKLPIPLYIGVLQMYEASITYKERSAKTKMAGEVKFLHTAAAIHNISNIPDSTAKYPYIDAYVDTRFLNRAPLNVKWRFYINDPQGKFDITAEMGLINATYLNELTEPMGPMHIDRGIIDKLKMQLFGTNMNMEGTVELLYRDLKVKAIKVVDDQEFKQQGLKSFVANLIIKNNNPARKDKTPRIARVQNERDTNRSMFHLIWKTIFLGIKDIVGV